MKKLEKTMKALANARRLTILKFLKRRRKATVGEIATEIDLSFKSTSKHLAVLLSAEVVGREQISLQMWYTLAHTLPDGARQIISLL